MEMDNDDLRCERCESPLEGGDLRCSICGLRTTERTAHRTSVEVQILRCTGCGAAVAYDPEQQAPKCTFCDSVFHIETREDPLEQTEGYLPFTVSGREARTALRNWLGSLGWFRPSDLRSSARLESLEPLWWVGWIFDADALVSWAADSNQGSRRSAWAPHSGQVEMNFDDIIVSASRGLSDDEVYTLAPHFDCAQFTVEPEGADDAILEQFDLQRSQARRRIIQGIEAISKSEVARKHVPGTKHRNVNVAVRLRRLDTRRLSFPAYVMAYRYGSKLYRAVVCGQNAGCVTGNAPYSLAKIALVSATGVLFLAIVLALVLSNL